MQQANYQCAACHSTDNLCIDHCHQTGQVRGVLCNTCNLTLGRLHEDTQVLANLITYLEVHHVSTQSIQTMQGRNSE
jgi:hypothetical protein